MPVSRDVFGNRAIAHSSLKGSFEADRYTDGTLKRVCVPITDIKQRANGPAPERQVLFGHPICQLENTQGLSRDETSGYVGYIAPKDLGTWTAPTHRVAVRSTLLFSEPDFKYPNPVAISLGSLVTVQSVEGIYAQTPTGQYAIAQHLEPIGDLEKDLAATAEKLLGTPYLWAGNSSFGIDCSGLIQLCAQRAGLSCPGDSDQQMALGHAATGPYKRNDLLFWKGHVALVTAPDTIIHANAGAMATVFEPITDALTRISQQGGGAVTAHRRLPFLSD